MTYVRFIWNFDDFLTLFPKESDTVRGFPSPFRDRADKPPPDVGNFFCQRA
jgi:hypothetical protein